MMCILWFCQWWTPFILAYSVYFIGLLCNYYHCVFEVIFSNFCSCFIIISVFGTNKHVYNNTDYYYYYLYFGVFSIGSPTFTSLTFHLSLQTVRATWSRRRPATASRAPSRCPRTVLSTATARTSFRSGRLSLRAAPAAHATSSLTLRGAVQGREVTRGRGSPTWWPNHTKVSSRMCRGLTVDWGWWICRKFCRNLTGGMMRCWLHRCVPTTSICNNNK